MSALPDPRRFALAAQLEAEFGTISAELAALPRDEFVESPDSLTTVADGYDERGWRAFALCDEVRTFERARELCPRTVRVLERVEGMVNASFSLFEPGTRLYPHRGERPGVLRCHLGLIVPTGDVGLRLSGELVRWRPGRAFVFDDTCEHEAWNLASSERVVLIVTFRSPAASHDPI